MKSVILILIESKYNMVYVGRRHVNTVLQIESLGKQQTNRHDFMLIADHERITNPIDRIRR